MRQKKATRSAPLLAKLAEGTVRLCARLPIERAQQLGAGLGYLSWLLPNRLRATSAANIALCLPELSRVEQRRLVKRSLIETGKVAGEAGAFFSWSVERLAALEEDVVSEELLSRSLEEGRGVILLVPHIGNWEFFNHFLMARHPFLALYRPPRIREIESMLVKSRERTGCRMASSTHAGLREIYHALASNGLVLVLPDQEPLKKHGVFAPLFGVPALTMTLVARLVRSLDCRVLYGFAERRPQGRFRVHLKAAPEGLDDPDSLAATTQMNRGVEACVRACPEQYMWSYRRFRTRPPGEGSTTAS